MLDRQTAERGIETITDMVIKQFHQPKQQVVAGEEDREKELLRIGVGQRLRGAYACYTVGKQLECFRHILLALGSIAHAIGWENVSAYVDQQNRILLEMSKGERGEA